MKKFECRICLPDRQCKTECAEKPVVCLIGLRGEFPGPMPQWHEEGEVNEDKARANNLE